MGPSVWSSIFSTAVLVEMQETEASGLLISRVASSEVSSVPNGIQEFKIRSAVEYVNLPCLPADTSRACFCSSILCNICRVQFQRVGTAWMISCWGKPVIILAPLSLNTSTTLSLFRSQRSSMWRNTVQPWSLVRSVFVSPYFRFYFDILLPSIFASFLLVIR